MNKTIFVKKLVSELCKVKIANCQLLEGNADSSKILLFFSNSQSASLTPSQPRSLVRSLIVVISGKNGSEKHSKVSVEFVVRISQEKWQCKNTLPPKIMSRGRGVGWGEVNFKFPAFVNKFRSARRLNIESFNH